MAKQTITPGSAPIVWSTVDHAFDKINANFTELYATILGETIVTAGNFVIGQQYTIVSLGTTDFTLIGAPIGNVGSIFVATGVGTGSGTARPKYNNIDFESLDSNIIPNQNDTYDLGSPQKKWGSLYLSNTLVIGGAAITNEGLTINLPSGTRVGGDLIIDPDKAFFKEFSVNSSTSVVADQFNDVLDFNAGTGIQLTVTSTNDQINITNTGVTSLVAGTAMAVSASTGTVTVNNTGVTAITAGLGMSRNTATGAVTIVNEGIIDVDSGVGISVGARDATTGRVIVTNTLPAGNAYRIFATAGEPNLTARSTADTITLIEGAGINITNTVASGTFTNRITLENTGVLSLTVGAGLTVSAATGAVTLNFNNRIDIIGSVFGDDSTAIINGIDNTVSGTTVTGGAVRLTGSTISTTDSSGITVITATTFNSDVTVENELIVSGNLIVNGTTTTINSVTLTVDDKNIELGSTASPTDVTADGGGITLKGATDKTFTYVNSTGLWTANIGVAATSFTGAAAAATTASTAASVGYMGIPQSATAAVSNNTTLVIGDAGKHIYVNTASQTIIIPANASVAYPIGTAISFIAGPSAGTVTIAITTDIMYLAGTGTTGSRTLAAHGMATAIKVSATDWYINGTGLT
jgi:hypothetical protein